MQPKQIAIVTGAGKGIGKAIADRLIRDGFYCILADVDEMILHAAVNETGKSHSEGILCNIADENSVRSLFENTIRKYGKVDVVINNAGILRDNMIWNMSAEEFDLVIKINLKGTWLMCREASKIMRGQKKGRIINIASRAWLGNAGQSNYSASKAGVLALSRVLALELGKYNVLVNTVAPGLIDTPMTRELSDEVREKLIQAIPGKKIGKAEDVANLVSFLASENTQYITGQVFYVDGGKHIGAG